jgi:putative DNA modification/repair radical SAM protein
MCKPHWPIGIKSVSFFHGKIPSKSGLTFFNLIEQNLSTQVFYFCIIMTEATLEKLKILAAAAKYDVSCSSSGTVRRNDGKGVGNTVGGVGICHSFAADGRCIALLKIMLTNYCKYDCAYCVNRRSNDIPRATLSVSEVVDITMEFYRRNYIEGLFLSSGVVRNADYTMERIARIAKDLRTIHRFNGYIHLKSIPGASQELVNEAGRYADRMSVNIEIPREESLRYLAPEKNHQSIFEPMSYIRQGVLQCQEDRKTMSHVPRFVPAGQSTQMIVGATPDTDRDILLASSSLYGMPTMRRVYYSGYVSVNTYDSRLPALKQPPLVRENRLYQADWLMRFYHFKAEEIADDTNPNLDLEVDPKLGWALRHPEAFPVDVNRAPYEMILRVPGIGVKSATLIVNARRYRHLNSSHLSKIGVVMKRARYFITCGELTAGTIADTSPEYVRKILTAPRKPKGENPLQLSFDFS